MSICTLKVIKGCKCSTREPWRALWNMISIKAMRDKIGLQNSPEAALRPQQTNRVSIFAKVTVILV